MGALTWLFPFLLYFLQYQVAASSSSPLSSFASSAHPLCRHDQRSALLQLKHMFTVKSSASSECDEESYPKTLSWDENATNCCDWDGVTCDELTGHVVGLDLSCSQLYGTIQPNSSLFQLSHLQRLNLAHNDFNGSRISYAFGNLASLTHLNLSFSVFSGSIPSELSLLRKLISLDLSYFLLSLERLHFKILLKNLSRLQELVLQGVNISSGLPDSLSNLTSLTALDLSSTELIGNLPDGVFHLPNLQKLVLYDNLNLDINLPKSTWGSGGSLRALDLSKTSLSRELPDSIGYLKSLKYLDLSRTNISGELPDSIGYLKSLKSLDLFETSLSGELPDSIGNLKSLKFLRLSGTSLSGKLPDSIGNLKSLNYLNLAWCKLRGSISKSLGNLTQIRELYFSGNDFTGEVPSTISNLKQLTHLYLRHNNFTGPIPFNLSGLQNLRELYLYNNSLSGVIPPSLFTLMSLEDLKLSCNHLTGQIPEFQHHLPLEHLNLSHNFLTNIKQLPWEQLDTLDLRSNLLQGPLPIPPPLIRYFFISINNLSGEIPSLICNVSSLVILDLSHNKLSGAAPQCLGNFSSVLLVLNLRSNRFTGTLPLAFTKPNPLQSLDFSGNHFEGPLPRSLKNCTWLEVLNVGNNKINDTFPNWLGTLPRLQVLVVRSNRFHGHINTTMSEFSFPKLRIVDLSYNEFTGHLPTRYFENFQAMKNITTVSCEQYMSVGGSSYHDSLIVTMKGHEFELVRILTIFTTIDFSCNNFSGEIPNVVGKLNSLILLNFSHNSLTGHIPASLGNLTNLESLDISFNQLTGKIPSQLTSLTFLAVLNLSRNRLHGPIPRGKQFATFENGSYAGNLGLCGFPLSKECQDNRTKVQPPVLQHEEDDSDFDGFFWKVVVIGYGCGMTLGLFLGSLMFLIGRPRFFVKLVERKLPKKVILLRS